MQPVNGNNNGHVEIKLKELNLIVDYTTILHVIGLTEIGQAIDNIEFNTEQFDAIDSKDFLLLELNKVKTEFHTIQIHRVKRGLAGSDLKWIADTMDDEDRSRKRKPLQIINQNNHNIIESLNKNILINNYFNETMNKLTKAIETDRTKSKEIKKQFLSCFSWT